MTTALPYVVTGAASGIGAATRALLESRGHEVIGVDLRGAEVVADLSKTSGRRDAIAEITAAAPQGLAGVVPCAGVAGLTGVDAALLVSVNYFGAVELIEGLRPLLQLGSVAGSAAVVVLSSNSVTCQPGWNSAVAQACLAGTRRRRGRRRRRTTPYMPIRRRRRRSPTGRGASASTGRPTGSGSTRSRPA